ncbi:response regulator transcription factor [Desulfopila inferna]|uniref:response regulator transcription factor n=1 Tax=Desulfopila inferna TaxID=468528 RepID=UPI00196380A0|nr:response regulator transcription factor [Desulfopila inferna]MBM9604436.1 response regulator transcription factor [Desulfopila inferna]
MKKHHILIVEDDSDIQQLVSYNLIRAGFNVTCADSGEEALECLQRESFDCILLDLMLPGLSGIEVCRYLRKNKKDTITSAPIIMLTAKGEEEDIIVGLESGADDYIPKPFSPKVLIARIKAVLRRSEQGKENKGAGYRQTLTIDNLSIDPARHEVRLGEELLQLTMTEFGILTFLAKKPGWVFTRQQIIDSVRGYDFLITPRAIDVQIFGLRKKMRGAGKMIETVRGIGYRLKTSREEEDGEIS